VYKTTNGEKPEEARGKHLRWVYLVQVTLPSSDTTQTVQQAENGAVGGREREREGRWRHSIEQSDGRMERCRVGSLCSYRALGPSSRDLQNAKARGKVGVYYDDVST
jgi:hypothetical protein